MTSQKADRIDAMPGRLILVLPFENRSGDAKLNWIGDSFPDTLNQRLNSAGFLTITRDDRQFALDHLGFPVDFKPTRATTIRIAQTLDANYVIVGNYSVNNGRIAVQARVLEVKIVCASPRRSKTPANSPGSSTLRTPSPGKSPARSTPNSPSLSRLSSRPPAASSLPRFENYIRGTDAPSSGRTHQAPPARRRRGQGLLRRAARARQGAVRRPPVRQRGSHAGEGSPRPTASHSKPASI